MAADLDLLGRGLQTATEVAFWPDGGVASPTEVHTIPLVPADVSATKVTVRSPALLAAAPSARRYRVSVRISSRVYTPYVLLELTP